MASDKDLHILLIDDIEDNLNGLEEKLKSILPSGVVIDKWLPDDTPDASLEEDFESRVFPSTALVITDYDLTKRVKGFLGLSIVAWCQKRSLPVGDYSRGHVASLPDEPNLFELRIPPEEEQGAVYIDAVFRGFTAISSTLNSNSELIENQRSLATVLAQLLGRPHLESQFAVYMSRLGTANAGLFQVLRQLAAPEGDPSLEDKSKLVTYVLGHVLMNSILKYPGPILPIDAVCSYMACDISEEQELVKIFERALYTGPFDAVVPLYWREDVDLIIEDLSEGVDVDAFESFADYNRHVVSSALKRPLATHQCKRCGGTKGGYWCPFTKRTVCERPDCSVPSSSWIPQGAQLSRVERDFHDEWAPIMGM